MNSIKSSLRDYSSAYTPLTGNITVTGGYANTKVVFKNCKPFKTCRNEINVFVDNTDCIYIAMHMYNLIEYGNHYSDTSESLWQFKRDEKNSNADVITANSSSFKYKSDLSNIAADATLKGVKIPAPLKYLSNLWQSLEMPLINCKLDLELVLASPPGTAATFKMVFFFHFIT